MTQANITYPVDALTSYHYYRRDEGMLRLITTGRLRIIGDSGAFSAATQNVPIDIAEYAAWCRQWKDHLFWMASLDVIGDPATSLANWRILRDRYGLATVPTIHLGTDQRWLDAYARDGVDFVGLGGMVGKPQPVILRWCVHVLRYARHHHPQMRFHAWGQASRKFLDSVPVYSADSSGIFGEAYRYALLRIFDPTTGRDHKIKLDGSTDVIRIGGMLRRWYGVDPNEIRTSHSGNRAILIQLATASTQLYATWLQRRHNVSTPRWGINFATPSCYQSVVTESELGPKIHLVATDNDLCTAVAARPGPRKHIADTDSTHLNCLRS